MPKSSPTGSLLVTVLGSNSVLESPGLIEKVIEKVFEDQSDWLSWYGKYGHALQVHSEALSKESATLRQVTNDEPIQAKKLALEIDAALKSYAARKTTQGE